MKDFLFDLLLVPTAVIVLVVRVAWLLIHGQDESYQEAQIIRPQSMIEIDEMLQAAEDRIREIEEQRWTPPPMTPERIAELHQVFGGFILGIGAAAYAAIQPELQRQRSEPEAEPVEMEAESEIGD